MRVVHVVVPVWRACEETVAAVSRQPAYARWQEGVPTVNNGRKNGLYLASWKSKAASSNKDAPVTSNMRELPTIGVRQVDALANRHEVFLPYMVTAKQ